ncbi:hypothetical protein Pcinc_027593 [Petrolisthes cinctipes]|uniref:Uncharacterized protein n=1 Tax=Petrolisthes cinctipes TaxID=88211 RepID=A0AAE1K6L3_PETCI|nr:hypothetical protein Pcinc_027593 [Petrolisthes cinctipes]
MNTQPTISFEIKNNQVRIACILKHVDASGLTKDVISSLVQHAIDRDDRAAEKAAVRGAEEKKKAAGRQAEEKKAEREHELTLVQLKNQHHNNVPFRPADE